jgi:hypothetical protein
MRRDCGPCPTGIRRPGPLVAPQEGLYATTADGRRPALIDPAVSWTWPEVDLGMVGRIGLYHPPTRLSERDS